MKKLIVSSVALPAILLAFGIMCNKPSIADETSNTDSEKELSDVAEPTPIKRTKKTPTNLIESIKNRSSISNKANAETDVNKIQSNNTPTKKTLPFATKKKMAPKTVEGFGKPKKEKPIVSSVKIVSFDKDNLEINNINRMYKRPARSIFGDPKDPNFDPASIPSTPISNGVPGNPLLYPTRIPVAFPKSLMFSKSDFDKISIAIDEGPFSRDPAKARQERERSIFGNGNLYVSAIVYEGNNNWSAWINNLKVMPNFDDPVVKVISITQDNIELFIKGGTVANDRRVRLKSNQTYVPTKGKIYEGIIQ
jgi:hypothetical protein